MNCFFKEKRNFNFKENVISCSESCSVVYSATFKGLNARPREGISWSNIFCVLSLVALLLGDVCSKLLLPWDPISHNGHHNWNYIYVLYSRPKRQES